MDAICTDAVREVVLTNGHVTMIDEADWPLVSKFNWYASRSGRSRTLYVRATIEKVSVKLHRLLLNAPAELMVDHRDGNGLNNVRSNLRLVTSAQNQMNMRRHFDAFSKYKGVWFCKTKRRWYAEISCYRKRHRSRSFACEEEAARAYDEMAVLYHGEFASLNFPILPSHAEALG